MFKFLIYSLSAALTFACGGNPKPRPTVTLPPGPVRIDSRDGVQSFAQTHSVAPFSAPVPLVVEENCLIQNSSLPSPPCVSAENQPLFAKIVQEAEQSGSDSLIIVQGGATLYRGSSGDIQKVNSVQSVTKSISALAVMRLVETGAIASLDLPMSTWIGAWASDAGKSHITLRMIMNHTSGIPDTDKVPGFFKSSDLVAAAENVPLVGDPGHQFIYSTIAITLLEPVIAQASGASVLNYVQDQFFTPLDIVDAVWVKDASGHEQTGGGLFLSADDLLKIGKMMLGKGTFNGATLLSPATVATLTAKSQTFFAYGLLWWLDLPSPVVANQFEVSSAYGWGGQYITIFPDKQLVAIRTKDPSQISLDDPMEFEAQGFSDFRNLVSGWQ